MALDAPILRARFGNEAYAEARQSARDRNGKEMPRWLQTACELLNDCYNEPITVGRIAATIGVHPFHLTRTFRRFFHCSSAEYLRKVRIEKAFQFLQNPNGSLVEIALSNGFSDQSQFTKCFKRVTGLTPGEYRRTFS